MLQYNLLEQLYPFIFLLFFYFMGFPFLPESHFIFALNNLNLLVNVSILLCNLLVIDVLTLVSQEILLLLASIVHFLLFRPHILKPILQFFVFDRLLYASKERVFDLLVLFL